VASVHGTRVDASVANGHAGMVDAGVRDGYSCRRWRDDESGQEFGFTGEMLEVELHSKIVHTQIYDPGDSEFGSMGDEPAIITVTFDETGGITNVETSIKYASKADRDAAMSTGMTDGMEMSYQALDGVLAG
jgi:uncharacterized protein YndB with AHSA1/START domain